MIIRESGPQRRLNTSDALDGRDEGTDQRHGACRAALEYRSRRCEVPDGPRTADLHAHEVHIVRLLS